VYGFFAKLKCFPVGDPKVRIVPKFAATLASLLLIASSIGINIARYPQVGRTIDAEHRADVAQPSNSAPTAQQPSIVESPNPNSPQASEAEIGPAKSSQVAAVAPVESPHFEEPLIPKPAASPIRSQPQPAVPILDARPMIPVARLRKLAGEADPPAGYDEVLRLPPVEPNVSPLAEPQSAGPDENGPYPATSTP
jgi:hypothetical protein